MVLKVPNLSRVWISAHPARLIAHPSGKIMFRRPNPTRIHWIRFSFMNCAGKPRQHPGTLVAKISSISARRFSFAPERSEKCEKCEKIRKHLNCSARLMICLGNPAKFHETKFNQELLSNIIEQKTAKLRTP